MPSGNPEAYDLQDQGWELSLDELQTTAAVSHVLNVENDYLDDEFRIECCQTLPHLESIIPNTEKRNAKAIQYSVKQLLIIGFLSPIKKNNIVYIAYCLSLLLEGV